MPRLGCLPIFLFLLLLALLPFVFAHIMVGALIKLRLEGWIAVLVVMGILFGSFINLPVKRIIRHEDVVFHPFAAFGLMDIWPQFQRLRRETIIAVNVGGCLIPAGLATYEILQLVTINVGYALSLGMAVTINAALCYWLAKPVEGIGIAMPALIPPVVAALTALLLAPDEAPAVAFVAGVLGPLVGADIFHLRDIPRIATGMASIGGAGTFDGIVLSGIMAAYLA